MTISKIIEVLKYRKNGQREWLKKQYPQCVKEQKHLDEPSGVPTTERIYWHYGYSVALGDVLRLLEALIKIGHKEN